MSRSRRKTPIFSYASSRSERFDKQQWHRRWRQQEKIALADASPEALADHLTVMEKEVSNAANMSKDGRFYWPLRDRTEMAEISAETKAKTKEEREALITRLLRRRISK